MNQYELWLRNALEQANQDDSWHLNKPRRSSSIVSLVAFLAALMFFVGVVMLSR